MCERSRSRVWRDKIFFFLVNWIYAIFGWVVRNRFVCAASARIGMASLCVFFFLPESANFLCRVRHERIGDRVCFAGGAMVILLL